jgi:uncharacterized protein
MNQIETHKSDIVKLCKAHKVKSLYAFGSVLTDKFNEESDIDLIVNFTDMVLEDYADNYFNFKFLLQDLVKRPIDLLEENAIKNPFFRESVDKQKQLIYEQ